MGRPATFAAVLPVTRAIVTWSPLTKPCPWAVTTIGLELTVPKTGTAPLPAGPRILPVRPAYGLESVPSDPFKDQAVNLLLMGTDIRDGTNADIGGTVSGMRSDTTMLVHISADRQWIEIVSLPRDTFVDIPSCKLPDGSQS